MAELAASLKSLALRMTASPAKDQRVHIALLANLAEVVRRSPEGTDHSAAIIQQIAQSVGRFSGAPASAAQGRPH